MQKNIAQKYRLRGIGLGGWHCPCCDPTPKHHRKHVRAAKKAMRRELDSIDFAE